MASNTPSDSQKTEHRSALLIEPSPASNPQLTELFDQSVWKLSYADDNKSAIQLAQAKDFDLILTNAATSCAEDILVLRQLRTVRPHARVIILTKEWMQGDILQAIQNHAFSYFTLPIATEDLRNLIQHSLEQPVWDDGIELIQGTAQYVVLAVRCDLPTLDRLMQFMRESSPLPEVESEELGFAFREIMLNAIEHGGKFDPGKFVEICYLKSKRMVMCRVKDPGEGFSLPEIREAEMAGPLIQQADQLQASDSKEPLPRGLGILMAQKFVDDLIFNEKRNEAFLVKYLP